MFTTWRFCYESLTVISCFPEKRARCRELSAIKDVRYKEVSLYSLKGLKMMLIINITLKYPILICWLMSISLRAIEMIRRMKSKAPTLEIKAFHSLRRVAILKVQQAT